jgi:hypothetical protein
MRGFGLHPADQGLEIPDRQVQIEIEFAEIIEVARSTVSRPA